MSDGFSGTSAGVPVLRETMVRMSARDWFRLYRVRDWLHFLPLPLAGWITGGTSSTRALVGGVVGWALALAYTSAINQAFDDRLDRLHIGKNPVGGSITRRQAILLSLPPALASVAVVAWLSPTGLVPTIVLLLAATLYSAPPRLKRVPVLGTLWNLLVGLPGLFFADRPDITGQPLRVLAGAFALLLLVSQLIHEAEDREDDRLGGVSTVATVTGMNGALSAASMFLMVMPGAVWWLANGLTERTELTIAAALFAGAWTSLLLNRIRLSDSVALRRTRLNYRYSAFALGALIFAAAARTF